MKKGLSLRLMHESFYQSTCKQCDLALNIQSIILLVCASASLPQLLAFHTVALVFMAFESHGGS